MVPPGLDLLSAVRNNLLPIIGMNMIDPEAFFIEPSRNRIAEECLCGRADERRSKSVRVALPHDRLGQAEDQLAITLGVLS